MRIIPSIETTDIIKGIVSTNVSIMCRVFPPLTSAVDATGVVYKYATMPSTAVEALRQSEVYKQCSGVISSYTPSTLLSRALPEPAPQEAWREASPDFDLVFEDEHFEERKYRKLQWVCTQMKHYSLSEATREGEYKLHKYVNGLNDKQIQIEMTLPFLVKIDSVSRTSYESLFTVAFCVPDAHKRQLPEPLMPGVYLDSNNVLNVYVRSFSGLVDDDRWMKEAALLVSDLNNAGKTDYVRDSFCLVSYGSRYKLENRHSEVWCIRYKS